MTQARPRILCRETPISRRRSAKKTVDIQPGPNTYPCQPLTPGEGKENEKDEFLSMVSLDLISPLEVTSQIYPRYCQQPPHILRYRRLEPARNPRHRVLEFHHEGVKRLPYKVPAGRGKCFILNPFPPRGTVGLISDDWKPHRPHVHPDLVRPPRDEPAPQKRQAPLLPLRFRHDLVERRRLPAACLHNRHPLAVGRVPPNSQVNPPLLNRRPPVDDRQILLLDRMALHEARDPRVRGVRPRNQENPRSVLVEPVHDSRPFRFTTPVLGPKDERVDECALPVSYRRMHHQPGRLVDHQKVLVFVKNRKRNVLPDQRGLGRRGRGQPDTYPVPCLYFLRRLGGNPLSRQNESSLHPLLNLGSRNVVEIRQVPLQNSVQPLSVVTPVGFEFPDGPFGVHAG